MKSFSVFAALSLIFLIAGCASHSTKTSALASREVSGTSDRPVQLTVATKLPILTSPQDIPSAVFVELTIDDVEHVLVHLDTAAPMTSLGPEQLSELGLAAGFHDIWIGDREHGVHVGKKMIVSIKAAHLGALHVPGIPSAVVLRGSAGTDLFSGLAIGLDLRGRNLWLIPSSTVELNPTTIPKPSGLKSGAPISIGAELASAGATEGGVLFTRATFDRNKISGTFLVDTGANTNLSLSRYWQTTIPLSSRTLPFNLEDYRGEKISGAYQMSSNFAMDDQVIASRYPVWVLDQFPVLDYEGKHFNREIDGLIGLWGLYGNYAVLDFGPSAVGETDRKRIFLYATEDENKLEANYFTGFGFTSHGLNSPVLVAKGSSAERSGLRDGDILIEEIGAQPSLLATGIISGREGEYRYFKFKRIDKTLTFRIRAERLLRH